MEFVNFMFADAVVSDFVSTAFPIIRAVLLGIVTIACLIMIVTTLLQSSANQAGSSAVMGGENDSYFAHNKDNSRDGRLKRTTITMASIIVGCLVVYFLTGLIITL